MVTPSRARKNRRHERDIQHASDHRSVDRTYLGDPVPPLTHHLLSGERGNALLRGTAHRMVHLQRQKRLRAQCSRRILQLRSDPGARLSGRHCPRLHRHFVARIFHHLGDRLHRQHRDPNPGSDGCFPPRDVPLPTHSPAAPLRSADTRPATIEPRRAPRQSARYMNQLESRPANSTSRMREPAYSLHNDPRPGPSGLLRLAGPGSVQAVEASR